MSGLSFTGKVVLVTGASSLVGSELAKYFSKLGASLVLTDCDKYRLNVVGEECSGSPVLKIAADLTKNEDVKDVIKQTIDEFKKLDVLINYVGLMDNFTADGTPCDAFKHLMNVSLCSAYCLTQLAHPHLVKTKGNVVNVVGSHFPPNALSSQFFKRALDELIKSLASEFSSEGVRVNAVSAGSVEPESPGKLSEKSIGLRVDPGPEDIAAAVVFLASNLANFIIGANLPVDGGKHLACYKPVKVSARSNVSKLEQSQPDSSHKKESSAVSVQSKRDAHKEEPTNQPPAKHDARKIEPVKSTIVKQPGSEKTSKPAAKNHN